MLLRRIFEEKLAQASYLVVCDRCKVAMVVDPNRNIQQYIDAAAHDNARITHVTETHIHADFVSGARELAEATGAKLFLSGAGDAEWQYAFAKDSDAELLVNGSKFTVGEVEVEAVHTPGHTPEHLTFLLTDTASAKSPMGALTGDFIFVGDVGRPDLLERAAGMAGTMEAGARRLFASLQKFKARPDYLQLWPGHGAGSACGKALGAMPQTTLGYERLFNWGLAEDDEARFVDSVVAGQPEPPAYFARMKRVNRDGGPPRANRLPLKLTAPEVAELAARGTMVVDTRLPKQFNEAHAAGTVSIPRTKSFLTYAGSLLPYDEPVAFIAAADDASRQELGNDLSLIGFESIAGVVPVEEIDQLRALLQTQRVDSVTPAHIARNGHQTILDVRGRSEYEAGHLASAINIPLGELQSRLSEVPDGEVVVHCQGGTRSTIAASILQKEGRSQVSNMQGGFAEWERSGHPVERGT